MTSEELSAAELASYARSQFRWLIEHEDPQHHYLVPRLVEAFESELSRRGTLRTKADVDQLLSWSRADLIPREALRLRMEFAQMEEDLRTKRQHRGSAIPRQSREAIRRLLFEDVGDDQDENDSEPDAR